MSTMSTSGSTSGPFASSSQSGPFASSSQSGPFASSSRSGPGGLRRIPKMSQIAPPCGEEPALSADSVSEISSVLDMDETASISSGSIASNAFIEDPDHHDGGFPLAFQYGQEMSCADLCKNYQLSKLDS